jgi:antitoxin MazE
MKAGLVRIGNSKGIRVPKSVVEECGFEDRRLEMRVEGSGLIIAPARRVRDGWDDACKAMAERGEDAPLFPDHLEQSFDQTEWGVVAATPTGSVPPSRD